jgi:hypothetical protein
MILEPMTNPRGDANPPPAAVTEMTKSLSPDAKTQVAKANRRGNANPPPVAVTEMRKNLSPDAKTRVGKAGRPGAANPTPVAVTGMATGLSLDAKTQAAQADPIGSAKTANPPSRENNPHGIHQMKNPQEEDTKKEQVEVAMKNHLVPLTIVRTQGKMIHVGMKLEKRRNRCRGIHQVLGPSAQEINPHGKSENATIASNTQTIWATALKKAVASKSAMMVASVKLQRQKNTSKPIQMAPYD